MESEKNSEVKNEMDKWYTPEEMEQSVLQHLNKIRNETTKNQNKELANLKIL